MHYVGYQLREGIFLRKHYHRGPRELTLYVYERSLKVRHIIVLVYVSSQENILNVAVFCGREVFFRKGDYV